LPYTGVKVSLKNLMGFPRLCQPVPFAIIPMSL